MNMTDLLTWAPVILGLALTVWGLLALRQGYSKKVSEIQKNVIEALNTQNETQARQIVICEREIRRLKRVVATIQRALVRRGLQVEIANEEITIIDKQTRRTHTLQIRTSDELKDDKTATTGNVLEDEEEG